MTRRIGALLVLLLLAAGVWAEEPLDRGPVPPAIDDIIVSERDAALAAMALATLERPESDRDAARALLVLLGDAGLKAVAARLAAGGLHPEALPTLLTVVAASEHEAADVLLARAARSTRPVVRMLAADGLGRGRSPRAVPVLATLARDAVPGVRIAALRSLFAIETPQALAARVALPADVQIDLLARRLTWHLRAGDTGPALRALATDVYRNAPAVAARVAAAEYLAQPQVEAPQDVLEMIVREMGEGPLMARIVRTVRRVPLAGYDDVVMRRIAIRALLTLLERPAPDAAHRARWVDQAVGWVAHPVAMDSYRRDPIPEHVLRRRLPDLGAEILEPVVRRLERHEFDEPRAGVILLRELGAERALPPLRRFLAPRAARPPFESRAETEQRRFLRSAAAGAVQEIGRIGDEALARALLEGDEDKALQIDVLHALREGEGAWVVPLLVDTMRAAAPASPPDPLLPPRVPREVPPHTTPPPPPPAAPPRRVVDEELRSHAISILEQRPEPEARAALVEDLFERMERPHDRLRALVQRADDAAYEVLRRALGDPRSYLRKAALSQFNPRRNPRLRGERARALLAAHTPAADSPQEIQDYVYALLGVDPEHAVDYVRARWSSLATNTLRMTLLRILGEAQGAKARAAAIDLALEKAAGDVPATMKTSATAVIMGSRHESGGGYDWSYRRADVEGFLRDLLESEDSQLEREAIAAWTHPDAPDAHARLLELLARALAGTALPERTTTAEGEQSFARDVLLALRHQPWERVESHIVDVALDPLAEDTTRVVAAHVTMGKLSARARARLMAWLDYTEPQDPPGALPADRAPGYVSDGILQLFLAAAIGEGADATTAAVLLESLRRELFEFYSPERLQRLLDGSPADSGEETRLWARVVPLARGVGRTKHVPTILAMLELVFDLRFAVYAQACVERQAEFARAAGVGAAALVPSRLTDLTHDDGGPYWGMPSVVHDILYEVKALDDEVLAEGFARVLEAARGDGRLAQFPALYLYRVQWNLIEPNTGRKPRTADVVLHHARRLGRPDGPIHYAMRERSARERADAERFAEAAADQRAAVRMLARGSHDDREPGLWMRARGVQDALEAAAAAVRGDEASAEDLFRRCVLRAPADPYLLNTAAWYRAMTGFGLEQAELEARRATVLEARVENRPSANAADTLATVLLLRDRPAEGLQVLGPRMRERGAYQNGLLHYHMAQLHAALDMWRSARDALVEALTFDRALEGRMAKDPRLAPLFEQQSLQAIAKLAAERRLEEELP